MQVAMPCVLHTFTLYMFTSDSCSGTDIFGFDERKNTDRRTSPFFPHGILCVSKMPLFFYHFFSFPSKRTGNQLYMVPKSANEIIAGHLFGYCRASRKPKLTYNFIKTSPVLLRMYVL